MHVENQNMKGIGIRAKFLKKLWPFYLQAASIICEFVRNADLGHPYLPNLSLNETIET